MTTASPDVVGPQPSPRQLKKLLKVYSKALRRHPNNLDLRTKLAEVLRLLDRVEEAIALYSSVAWAHGVAGHLGQAIMLCKIILQLNPTHSETQQMLAKLYASQRIREEKQSVPVVMVDGKWVADPRGTKSRALASTPGASEAVLTRGPVSAEAPILLKKQPKESSLHESVFDVEEPTKDESPSNPALMAKRGSSPSSKDDAPIDRENRSTSMEIPSGSAVRRKQQRPAVHADPAKKDRSAFAQAPTHLRDDVDQIVVTTDGSGQLVVDPEAASGEAVVKPTMQLPPTKVEELAKKVPSPIPALGMEPLGEGYAEEPTQLEDVPDEEVTELEEERITDKERITESAGREVIVAPFPPAPSGLEGTPTHLVPSSGDPGKAPKQSEGPTDVRESEGPTDVRESEGPTDVRESEGPTDVREIEPDHPTDVGAEGPIIEVEDALIVEEGPSPAAELAEIVGGLGAGSVAEAVQQASEPEGTAVPAAERISTGQLNKVASKSKEAQPVDYAAGEFATEVQEEPPPIPDDADDDEAAAVVATDDAGRQLSTTGMMDQLASALPQKLSTQYEQQQPAAQQEPPGPEDVEMDRTGSVRMAKPGRTPKHTAPGFLTALDREEVGRDPIRILRTTRRYATVEAPDGVKRRDTLVDQLDPGMVSSVIRMESNISQPHPSESEGKGLATIQKEVQKAGREQDDRDDQDVDADEEVDAERSLMDTIRDLDRGAVDDLATANTPRVPFPLFSDLETAAFLAMVEKLERKVYASGSLVFQEGDPGDSLFLVGSGNLEVLKKDDKGRLIKLARLGPGSFFGEFGLLTDRHRHASVRCIDECELLELRRDVLLDLIKEHPSISWTLRTFYQQRLMAMVIATSPLFQAVSPRDRREVLARFAVKRIMDGETIIEEGRPGTGFFIILVGEVAVSCLSEDGTEVPLGLLSEGDYFGEISLLTGTAAEATVRANAITEVLTLGASDFYDLASAHPEVWAEVQEEAERRQRDTAERLAEQAQQVKAAGPLCLI